MKLNVFAIFGFIILILCGCNTERFPTPDLSSPVLMVSHVNQEKMSFVDTEQTKVITENSHYPLTEMVSIGNGQIVATSQQEGSLLLYDLEKGTVAEFLEINEGLTGLTYNAVTNTIFVTDSINNKVHLVDMNTKELNQTIEVNSFPTDVKIGNDEVYILSGETHEVTVTDLGLRNTLRSFPVLERPAGMYLDGNILWVGGHGPIGELNKRIFGYDILTGMVVDEVEVGQMPIDFFGDQYEPYFYVLCHGDNQLYKVDKETGVVEAALSVGQNPNFITGNESELYVTNLDGDSLSIINRESFELKQEIAITTSPYSIVLLEESK